MCIEATPSGQGPVVHAHLPRYCAARGSSSSGVGALGRGAKSSFRLAVQYIRSMIACWANQEFMSDNVNLFAIGLVRAPRVFQSRGPQRDRPPADCSYPGLAWHMAHLTLPVTSGSGKSAAASRDGPSARPVPCPTLRPRPHSSPSLRPSRSLSHSRSTTYASSSLCPPCPLSHLMYKCIAICARFRVLHCAFVR